MRLVAHPKIGLRTALRLSILSPEPAAVPAVGAQVAQWKQHLTSSRLHDDGVLARSGQRLALRMPVGGPTSELIVEQLQHLGVEVDVRSDLDPLEELSSGDFDLMITSRPAPSNSKSSVANEFLTGAAFNYGAYSNPVIDDLLQRANSEADRAVRAPLPNAGFDFHLASRWSSASPIRHGPPLILSILAPPALCSMAATRCWIEKESSKHSSPRSARRVPHDLS